MKLVVQFYDEAGTHLYSDELSAVLSRGDLVRFRATSPPYVVRSVVWEVNAGFVRVTLAETGSAEGGLASR